MMPHGFEPARDAAANPRANGSPRRAPDLSVVVPCYNEEEVLDELHRRLTAACGAVTASYEVVLVNDGSRDRTWARMVELAGADPRLVLVNLSRNHGHQLALTAGLTLCRGERALIIDADLQDPPELLPEMMRVMDGGADVVFGRRRRRHGESGPKRLSAWLFYRLIERLSDVPMPHDAGDFRLLSRKALDVLLTLPEQHRYLRGMVSWIGFRQEGVPYDRDARFAGATKYSVRKMLRFATDAITAFSIKPLSMGLWLGPLVGAGACGLAALGLVRWLRGEDPSWPLVAAVAAAVGGLQLMALGVMGVYLGRLVEQARGRPLFVIDQVVRHDEHPDPERTRAARAEPR